MLPNVLPDEKQSRARHFSARVGRSNPIVVNELRSAAARVQRLDLKALEQGYHGREATLHREIRDQYPRLTIGINRTTDTSSVPTLDPAISLDLPLWNRNGGPIAIMSG